MKAALTAASAGVLVACGALPPAGPENTPDTAQASPTPTAAALQALLYAGTYAAAEAASLYRYRLDPARGIPELLDGTKAGANPSFLAFHPNGHTLYTVNEIINERGRPPEATISAFAVDPQSGGLTFINKQPSPGSAPCHLAADRQGNFLLVANYVGGSLAVYPLLGDGRIGENIQLLEQQGHGPNPARQDAPHPHYVGFAPDNRFALHCDLGLDRVVVYRFDAAAGSLEKSTETALAPGAGPRHLDFAPAGRHVYVINELDSTLAVFGYDAETGALSPLQTLSTLPAGFPRENTAAEVCVHPSGRFVYSSNRGHDSLAVYARDEATGLLTLLGHADVHGKQPRHFTIDPSGTLLLVANQGSNAISTFQLDPQTGKLTYLSSIDIPTPVCLAFRPGG